MLSGACSNDPSPNDTCRILPDIGQNEDSSLSAQVGYGPQSKTSTI